MTTYTTIADSEIDPESPGTTTLFTKLRDNPLAIQENDGSAPAIAYATSAGNASTITSQGALATLSSVTASQIDTNAVGSSEFDTDNVFSNSSGVNNAFVSNVSALSIPAGIYWVMLGSSAASELSEIQVYIHGAWVTVQALHATIPALHYQDDGTLTRIYNPSAGSHDYVSYVKLD